MASDPKQRRISRPPGLHWLGALVVVLVFLIPVQSTWYRGSTKCEWTAPLGMAIIGEITSDHNGVPLNLWYSNVCADITG